MMKRSKISNPTRLKVIEKSNGCCVVCGKDGFIEKRGGKYVLVEQTSYRKWINEYDGTFLFEHRTMEFDHIMPLDKDGKTELDNLQILCRKCNRKKGKKIG